MGNVWLKIKIWTKVGFFVALVVYAVLFILYNSERQRFWIWFGHEPEEPAVLYMFFAFGAGVLGTILFRTVFGTISQIRELRDRSRTQKNERRLADMEAKASRLQTLPPTKTDSTGTPPVG